MKEKIVLKFQRNNLDQSSSSYLRQHAENPVWWQEWSAEILKTAKKQNKPLFVSVGYATCHWCHVMAAGAFSDKDTADYLNEHFICIKVDREIRPDIDQFLMQFIIAQNGSGGWPLNVFLTPDVHPIFALTYAPAHAGSSMSPLIDICKQVYEYYWNHKNKILPFQSKVQPPPMIEQHWIIKNLLVYFDSVEGGFGSGQKFPPHSTLLYLLYLLCSGNFEEIRNMCAKTLDAMRLRGLHDHLQGGIFRYCVDKKWTIPHFEKMLYDQAMALWDFSLAYRVLDKKEYAKMAEGILFCLESCFKDKHFYISAFDADTDHQEGGTYIWQYKEIRTLLSAEEFHRLSEAYIIPPEGNFEGAIHLIRKNDNAMEDVEKKLLMIRNQKAQPDKDKKILCGLNALVAVAMLQAGRFLEKKKMEKTAGHIVKQFIVKFWDGKILAHSLSKGKMQKQGFLFDGACLLLAITMLYENDTMWGPRMEEIFQYVLSFKKVNSWIESMSGDFYTIEASWIDHPIPSSVSLAEMGVTRVKLFTGKSILPSSYRQSFQADFFNIAVMMQNGFFHHYTTEKAVSWNQLPANSMQMRGKPDTDCYQGTCRPFIFIE